VAPAASAPSGSFEPKPGDLAYLNVHPASSSGPRTFFLVTAPLKEAWERFIDLNRQSASNNGPDAQQNHALIRQKYELMASGGDLFSEFANTKVRVIGTRPALTVRNGQAAFYPVEIQILDGPRKDRRGFVSQNFVTPSPNTDPAFLAALADEKARDEAARKAALRAEALRRIAASLMLQPRGRSMRQQQLSAKELHSKETVGVVYDRNGVIIPGR
jgi:hypothetical protein